MKRISLGLHLEQDEWEKLPERLRNAITASKDQDRKEKARQAIVDAYHRAERHIPISTGFWDLFHYASEYEWPFDVEMLTMLEIALNLRLNGKAVTNPFEVNMINATLNKMEIGGCLGKSPWQEKFLAGVKTEMPDTCHILLLIEAVQRAGVDRFVYICALRWTVINEELENGFSLDTLNARKLLGMSISGESRYTQMILETIDAKLKADRNTIYRVVDEYRILLDEGIEIGPGRRSIVDVYNDSGEEFALCAAMEAGIIPMEEEEKEEEVEAEIKPWWKFW